MFAAKLGVMSVSKSPTLWRAQGKARGRAPRFPTAQTAGWHCRDACWPSGWASHTACTHTVAVPAGKAWRAPGRPVCWQMEAFLEQIPHLLS